MNVATFLEVALASAHALSKLHANGVVHRNIKPSNLVFSRSSGEAEILDLSLATRTREAQAKDGAMELIEGSLAYMAPEQTGRLSRPVDGRSDLYSLGISFYQLLTGGLPFQADDPLGWIHCHLARVPTPAKEALPGVAEPISDIVQKLMAKAPEDRYQTAHGLAHDLGRCLSSHRATGRIEPFPLGARDATNRLQAQHRLHGRDREAQALKDAFLRIADGGKTEIVLVSGFSGIGKSALVRGVEQIVAARGGAFIEGKFDQFKRDIPYSTLTQAIHPLVVQILKGSEDTVRGFRQRLSEALGKNARIVTDMIPLLGAIVGEQPPVPELPLLEAQNRFQMVFQKLIGVFAQAEHPLVLFLDDLQWADTSSAKLLQHITTHADMRHLLVIGAYRENEVDRTHLVMRTVEDIRAASVPVLDIVLGPLAKDDTHKLVADMVGGRDASETRELADFVHEKTAGNPFFSIQLLSALHEDGQIRPNPEGHGFAWDIAEIRAKVLTNDVVTLMVSRLLRLDPEVRGLLEVAACIGNTVDRSILALACDRSEADFDRALAGAVESGLVLLRGETCRFLHDRVQQAAYYMIPEAECAAKHVRIGRLLLAHTPEEKLAERAFDIVNQLNHGAEIVTNPAERKQIAKLNLLAARKAKSATAYGAASTYAMHAAKYMSSDAWETDYEMVRDAHLIWAECETHNGHLEESDRLTTLLDAHVRTNIDAASVFCVRASTLTLRAENRKAVEAGIACLRRFGIEIPLESTRQSAERAYAALKQTMADTSLEIEDIFDLPPMTDPEMKAALGVLATMYPPALFCDEHLLPVLLCNVVDLSLKYGNGDASGSCYVFFGMALGPYYGDYRAAYRFGKLGYDLVEKRGLSAYKAQVYLCFGQLINPWARHMRTNRDILRRAFEAAVETGDLTWACYCCNHLDTLLLALGEHLDTVYDETERGLEFVRKARFHGVEHIIVPQQLLVQNLRGKTSHFSTFSSEGFDADAYEKDVIGSVMPITVCWYYIRKTQARFLSGDYAACVAAGRKAKELIWTSPSFLEVPELYYFFALGLAAEHALVSADEQVEHKKTLAELLNHFSTWAESCPENFEHKRALIAAELARIEGRTDVAMRLYEEAIRGAHEQGFVQNEAIGYEVAARFYLTRGVERLGQLYLREARACFARWGARGKVADLEQQHPFLTERLPASATGDFATTADKLDLLSVVKSSQSISSELLLPRLRERLMHIVIEHAGAERGALLVCQGETTHLGASVRLSKRPDEHAETEADLPASVINYVKRSRETLVLKDASRAPGFSDDPYIERARVKSALCLPLMRRGALFGLLYLENNLASSAFTEDRLKVLELLASQAAISLEIATLYAELQQENAERRRMTEEVQKLNAELELRVEQRTAELRAANAELEAFSYSVSHDLRAPLRSIDGFLSMLIEDYGSTFDVTALDYVGRMRAGAKRMNELIRDLLELSRVTRGEVEREPVAFSALARTVAADLERSAPERQVELAIAEGPEVSADPRLLRIALENLIGNAFKFTSKRPDARIEVGADVDDAGRQIFFVRDNGAGFNAEHVGRLFMPFQRLHRTMDFPGTGIGLATVQRIVNRHGGRVWAKSEEGRGATFFFTLGG